MGESFHRADLNTCIIAWFELVLHQKRDLRLDNLFDSVVNVIANTLKGEFLQIRVIGSVIHWKNELAQWKA